MWNPLANKANKKDPKKSSADNISPLGMPDTKDMNMLQKFAMKRFMAMNPQEQKKMVEKMLTPKNIAKHKDEILAQLEQARKSGQMSDDQYRLAKKKFGL
jgi:hypothetical protein